MDLIVDFNTSAISGKDCTVEQQYNFTYFHTIVCKFEITETYKNKTSRTFKNYGINQYLWKEHITFNCYDLKILITRNNNYTLKFEYKYNGDNEINIKIIQIYGVHRIIMLDNAIDYGLDAKLNY